MKLLPPDMKSRNNFMTGEYGFHDAEKVNFADDRSARQDTQVSKVST